MVRISQLQVHAAVPAPHPAAAERDNTIVRDGMQLRGPSHRPVECGIPARYCELVSRLLTNLDLVNSLEQVHIIKVQIIAQFILIIQASLQLDCALLQGLHNVVRQASSDYQSSDYSTVHFDHPGQLTVGLCVAAAT